MPKISQREGRDIRFEWDYPQTAVNLASLKAEVDELPNKNWVRLRLWVIAGTIIAATGLMIRFLPAAG